MTGKKKGKGEYGYIGYQKKAHILYTFFIFAAALGVLVSAYFFSGHSRNNVGTVIAVVMTMPACKSLTGVIVLWPHKSVSQKLHDSIEKANEGACILFDMIMTSNEKTMYADAVAVDDENVVMLVKDKRQDTVYIRKYFSKVSDSYELGVKVRVCSDENDFIEAVKSMKSTGDKGAETVNTLKLFCF